MKTYNFVAKCAVSCNCSVDIEVEADSPEEAEALAWETAQGEFNGFSVEAAE